MLSFLDYLGFKLTDEAKSHTHINICHAQTDCFIVSRLFNVARHTGRFKLGSKPAQIYIYIYTVRQEQHKDVACCFEQIQETITNKNKLYGFLPPITQTIQVR